MARKPNLSTAVAVIRTALGLDAGAFAKLVGCGKSTIQHIETGDRTMKADLADKIHLAACVPREWLEGTPPDLETVKAHLSHVGPFFLGDALFPSWALLPKLEAAFYACGLKNLNPSLIVLAVHRAIDEAIGRLHLDRNTVNRLCQETERYRYGKSKQMNAEIEVQAASPGCLALNKYSEQVLLRIQGAGRVRGNKEPLAVVNDGVSAEFLALRKGAGLPIRKNRRRV